jgi:hypothetical protein
MTTDVQLPARYYVVGIGNGAATGWRVARLSDMAIAGFDSTYLRPNGAAYMENPVIPRTWAAYGEAQAFATGLESPMFNPVAPVVWLPREEGYGA